MKKFIAVLLALAIILAMAVPGFAEDNEGLFSYSIIEKKDKKIAFINGCNDKEISGELVIPAYIDGYKVCCLGKKAFEDCKNITSVHIGENVYQIDAMAFHGCTSLKKFTVSAKNKYFYSDGDGVLYLKRYNILICYPQALEYERYKIKSGTRAVRAIFDNCKNLKSLTYPKSVSSIEGCWEKNLCIIEFSSNPQITDIYYEGNPHRWEAMTKNMKTETSSVTVHLREPNAIDDIEWKALDLLKNMLGFSAAAAFALGVFLDLFFSALIALLFPTKIF